jgi:hypothetical protein
MNTNDMTIEKFCDRHDACDPGRDWALKNCNTMLDAWNTAKPDWVIWIATRKGVLTDRELRKLAVRFARTVQHLMKDVRSIAALDVADRHADGLASNDELAAAWDDARAAARDAAWDDARDAARDAAWAAARAAAWAAARAAARDAACEAARDAARAAACDAAWAAFAKMIREHTPNFSR